jgi:hypothetical protein
LLTDAFKVTDIEFGRGRASDDRGQ